VIRRRSVLTMTLATVLAAALAAPAMAQSPSAPAAPPVASIPAGPAITVIAKDYHFEGLPTTVPVGTTLTLQNQGTEYHELIVVRRNDGVTKTWDELLQMSDDESSQYVTFVGGPDPLIAAPGETAAGTIVIAQTGDYFAVCFVPQGSVPGPSPAPGASVFAQGQPHFMLGMRQDLTGTDAGTAVGPLPSVAPMASPMGSAAP
jgi:plastocyanin